MGSIREQILSQLLVKLKNVHEDISSQNVVRSRINPFDEKNFPCISLNQGPVKANHDTIGYINWELRVTVKLFCSSSLSTAVDSYSDEYVQAIQDLMMEDQLLGGLTSSILPEEYSPTLTEGNKNEIEIDMNFLINYLEEL